jgi:hypothetical protein
MWTRNEGDFEVEVAFTFFAHSLGWARSVARKVLNS